MSIKYMESGKMKIVELEYLLKNNGSLKIHVNNAEKTYVRGNDVYKNGKWHNLVDVFGVYQFDDGKYCYFITDSQRGIPELIDVFDSEEEACEELLKIIADKEYIYGLSYK